MVFTHYWRLRQFLPNRHGMLCRVIAASRRGKPVPACAIANPPAPKNMGSICIEFADGYRAVTSRYSVRRLPSPSDQEG